MTGPAVPEHDIFAWLAQRLPRLQGQESSQTSANRAKARKAELADQAAALADQLAASREAVGRQGAGQIVATAATQEQELFRAVAANRLVFSNPAPPAVMAAPIRTSDGMFGDAGGRPTDATVH
jgi:hypothetical protein